MTIRDTKFPVTVDDFGHFWSVWEGEEIGGRETLEELKAQLMKASREAAASIAVPFSIATLTGPAGQQVWRIRPGNGISVHAGNGNLIVEWGGGRREQDSGRWGSGLRGQMGPSLRRLTPVEEESYLELLAESSIAARALKQFEDERKLNVKQQVQAELALAMKAAQHGQD